MTTERTLDRRMMLLFAWEGLLNALMNNIINMNNNLFALRLGASDFQISLVIALPQIMGLLVLIPGGIWTDHLTHKRRMVSGALMVLGSVYLMLGFVPWMGGIRLFAFLGLLALSFAPMTLYNAAWQSYFSDVVAIDKRNRYISLRTLIAFGVGIVIPLVTGLLLASQQSVEGKLQYHQWFAWAAAALVFAEAFVMSRISGKTLEAHPPAQLRELGRVIRELSHNKAFLGFVGVALFFHMTWQADWTLYYLGQVHYLKMNEAWLSYVVIGSNIMMFASTGFWSRVIERRGVRFAIIPGAMGLILCEVSMLTGLAFPAGSGWGQGQIPFVILTMVANMTFATVPLTLLQMLLQVLPSGNKTLSISVYMILIGISNTVMPVAGVQLYTALGGTLQAIRTVFFLILLSRILSTLLWVRRWHHLRGTPK